VIWLVESWHALQAFMASGGSVVWWIAGVTFWMWTLILERIWYLSRGERVRREGAEREWQALADHGSWFARQIRRQLVSEARQRLLQSIPMIKTLVAVCPLLGLLGTVSGMIEVFDVMTLAGSGNARAMADGVAKATIPTMAGMVAALSGLAFSVRLERQARQQTEHLAGLFAGESKGA